MNNRKRKRAVMASALHMLSVRTECDIALRHLDVFFRLDENRNVVPVRRMRDLMSFENEGRRVGFDEVNGLEVSTVFLCVKHGMHGIFPGAKPEFFETAIIDKGNFDIVARYETWAEAEAGHARYVAKLKAMEEKE